MNSSDVIIHGLGVFYLSWGLAYSQFGVHVFNFVTRNKHDIYTREDLRQHLMSKWSPFFHDLAHCGFCQSFYLSIPAALIVGDLRAVFGIAGVSGLLHLLMSKWGTSKRAHSKPSSDAIENLNPVPKRKKEIKGITLEEQENGQWEVIDKDPHRQMFINFLKNPVKLCNGNADCTKIHSDFLEEYDKMKKNAKDGECSSCAINALENKYFNKIREWWNQHKPLSESSNSKVS